MQNACNHQDMKICDVRTFVNAKKWSYVMYERSQIPRKKDLEHETVVTVKKTYQRVIYVQVRYDWVPSV